MKTSERMSYTQKIRWRERGWWAVLVGLIAYMVVIAELGGGDSRMMTDLAQVFSRTLFISMGWAVYRIVHNRRLLHDRQRLLAQRTEEQDERNQYLHDKSGGVVWDVLFVCLLFTALTLSLFNMPAFYTAFGLLAASLIIKAAAYLYYAHR